MREGKTKKKISKSRIFFILSSSFLAGVFTTSFFTLEKSFLLMLFSGAVFIFLVNHKEKHVWLIPAAILFFIFGSWRTNAALAVAEKNLANSKTGPTEFFGTVVYEPENNEKYQKVIIQDANGENILINSNIYPIYQYGDQLKINCVLQEPKNYEESRFDYRMYLAKDKIYRVCNKPQLIVTAKNKGNKFYKAIIFIKNKFEESLSAIFPDPEGAYLKGLLLGGSKRMTGNITNAFSKTGTMHTVAVSGYNVTIVATFLMWLGIYLGLWRQQVFLFALVGIILFVLATGAPASAVRAGIMGSLVIWAMKEGRLANSANAILLAACVMLAVNPLLLRYDSGFQLSYLATLGIVYLSPVFEKYFEKMGDIGILKETVFLSVAAQIFVLPVILMNFESLSLVSPLANLLILPAIPYIMLGGFVAGITGFIFIPLGKIVGFISYFLLKAELAIIQGLAALPWSSLEIRNFGWRYALLYYIILVSFLFFQSGKQRVLRETNEK